MRASGPRSQGRTTDSDFPSRHVVLRSDVHLGVWHPVGTSPGSAVERDPA